MSTRAMIVSWVLLIAALTIGFAIRVKQNLELLRRVACEEGHRC